MNSHVSVTFNDLESAFHLGSADGGVDNAAFISRVNGAIYYRSADGFMEQEPPTDVEDLDQYWSVPDKNDLELGRSLVFRFVSEALPNDYDAVRSFFQHRGAYSKFKTLLERRGQ